MLKKLKQLDKLEKIELLKDVSAGAQIDQSTLFATGKGDFFLSLMMENENVHCLGVAKQDKKLFDSFIELPELNFDRIESGAYQCREDGRVLSQSEIQSMEDQYLISIEITDDLTQPPEGYKLIPKSKEMFIADLQK